MLGLERRAERAARKGAAFTAAALLGSVGLAFLTGAAWMVLVELRSAEFAALVIGGTYIGASAIVLAVGLSKPHHHKRESNDPFASTDLSALQMVILSFVQGFEQGRHNNRTP